MTAASQHRIERFVDWFIRSHWVESEWGGNSDGWIDNPDRAARCDAAAENGCDGSTHAEIIRDWRQAFARFLRSRNQWHTYDRFETAVSASFDAIEQWHETNGSLHEEIG